MLIKMKTVITIFKPLLIKLITLMIKKNKKLHLIKHLIIKHLNRQQQIQLKSNNKVSQTNSSGYNFDDDEDDVDTTNAQSKKY